MAGDPILVVRVAANMDAFRQNLKEGIAQIETTKREMTAISNAFDGSKIINQSGAVMAQIQAMGGVSKLTATEQARANAILDAALEKYAALGKEAPPGMAALAQQTKAVGDATTAASAPAQQLQGIYKQFDGVLQSLGVNIGPYVKGLEDITGASGQTAAGLGMIATAGLAIGAGYTGWKVGRAIADFFDLDEEIANATATLMGYGNVAEEVAGAKQDTINRAIANGAKETITYTEAILFNERALAQNTDQMGNFSDRLAMAEKVVQSLTRATLDEIDAAYELGASQEDVAKKFKISSDAARVAKDTLEKFADQKKAFAQIEKQLRDEAIKDEERAIKAAEQNAKKFADLEKENTALVVAMSGTRRDARLADIDAWFEKEVASLKKLDPQYGEFYDKLARQRDLKKQQETADYDFLASHSKSTLDQEAAYQQATLEAMIARVGEFSTAQIQQQKAVRDAAIEAARNWRDHFIDSADAVQEKAAETSRFVIQQLQAMSFSHDIQPLTKTQEDRLKNDAFSFEGKGTDAPIWKKLAELEQWEGTYRPKSADDYQFMIEQLALLAQLRMWSQGKDRPQFADGVRNFSGGEAIVGERGPEIVRLPRGSDVIPNHALGGNSVHIAAGAIVIQGPVVGGIDQLAEKLTASIMKKMRGQGFREPVGA